MAKYSYIELGIDKNYKLIGLDFLSNDQIKALKLNSAIYIYRSTKTKQIYVGQTVHFMDRHKQHYSGTEQKFLDAKFDMVIVLFSQYFNGSSLDDVEAQLITYYKADNPKAKKSNVSFDDDVINRTGGNSITEYDGREKVATDVILPFWEEVLYPQGWVLTPTLDELRTRALVKYSPIKQLTPEQSELIKEIIDNPTKNYVINGDAGTGKTVLLTHLVANILKDRKDARVGVVVQPNWEKTGEEIFKIYGMNSTLLTVTTSSKLITSGDDFDVIVVDESHKLSRRGSKQMAAFNAVYKDPQYANCQSHLEILQKIGKQVILMYDVLQAIRPANISRDNFATLTSTYEKKFLKTQFRIQAPKGKNYTSDDYVNGIKYLLFKDTGLLNSGFTQFDPNFNKEVFSDKTNNAYFGYYTSEPLKNLIDWLDEDKNYNPEHVNRVLAGLVEPWMQEEGKDANKFHFIEGNIKRRWNWTQENWVNSKDASIDYKADAEEQIGSVFAVQGIDLNKVGVLIGYDLELDENNHLYANPDHFHNVNGKFNTEDMVDPKNKFEFTLFVLNIYYILMTRGIDGIRVGFWKNTTFQKYMEDTLEIK